MADSLSNGSPARRSGQNLSGAWIIMLLSGLVAAVVFLYVTSESRQKFSVLVAAKDIPAGTVVDQSYFTQTELSINDQTLGRLVALRDRESMRGQVSAGFIGRGDLVMRSNFHAPASADFTRHQLTIPIDKAKAVNGALFPGDRINVLDGARNEKPLAENVEVVSTNAGGTGGIAGTSNNFNITVLVSPEQELALAKGVTDNKLLISRTTGAKR